MTGILWLRAGGQIKTTQLTVMVKVSPSTVKKIKPSEALTLKNCKQSKKNGRQLLYLSRQKFFKYTCHSWSTLLIF
jgi:hypothetical protein